MHSQPVATSISDEAIEWFARHQSGRLPDEEAAAFAAWLALSPEHARAYAEVEHFWNRLELPARRVADEVAVADLALHAQAGKGRRRGTGHWVPGALAMAAALLLVLWLPGFVRYWSADYRTDWGERRELALEDGSHVTLNTHSALSVNFSARMRQARIPDGEAYFQVTKDTNRPFVVETDHARIEVTGTAFDVFAQWGRTTVSVAEGRVRLVSPDSRGPAVELTPGMRIASDANGFGRPVVIDRDAVSPWRDDLLLFDRQALEEVIDQLNRYLPGKILIADPRVRQRIVSGIFDLKNPQNILPAIEKTLGLRSLRVANSLNLLYQAPD